MALPFGTTGSLAPTFVPDRLVSLTVKPPYTLALLQAISIRPEVTFARLRYSLGGDRPSQTARLALSRIVIQRLRLELHHMKGGIPTSAQDKPKSIPRCLPPILCIT